jgi:predicted ATPase
MPDELPQTCVVEGNSGGNVVALHRRFTEAVEHGRAEAAKDIARHLLPGMKDLAILTEGDSPIVHLVYEDHSVPVALAGDGVHSLIRLTLELAARERETVLLEEPEVHQHPGAIRQSVRAILAAVRRGIQVVLTTHSLELIDTFLAESSAEDVEKLCLFRLELQDGKLISIRIPGSEVAFSRGAVETDLR